MVLFGRFCDVRYWHNYQHVEVDMQTIRDLRNNAIGYLEEGRVGAHEVVFAKNLRQLKLGYFDKNDNTTRDMHGNKLFNGNMVQTLLKG